MVGLGFVLFEGILAHFDMGVSESVLLAALAMIGGGVYGDTVRPSGVASQKKTTVDVTTAG